MPETRPLRVQFTGPGTCGWVPVKSATTRSPSISTRTRIGNGPLPRPSSSMKSSASNTPRGRRATAARASASLRSCAARIAAVTSSMPYRWQSSSTRRSATSRQAANAVRSPIVMSGRRLFAPITATRSRSSSPPRATRTNGSCSPSWKISTESAVHDPGSFPPTSVQWPFAAANATSSPSTKIGRTIATSERWPPPPAKGSFVATTSPGARSGTRTSVSRVASPSGPRNPAMPLPCETSSPLASVRPTAKSRTS